MFTQMLELVFFNKGNLYSSEHMSLADLRPEDMWSFRPESHENALKRLITTEEGGRKARSLLHSKANIV